MKYLDRFLNFKLLVYAGFVFSMIIVVFSLKKYTLGNDPWILGDWLINYYDGGFKRRGLTGTIFIFIQNNTGIGLAYLVCATQLFLYGLFFYLFYLLLKQKKISFEYFILIFSPFFLLFYPNDTAIIGRKEILLFVLYAYLIYNIQTKKLTVLREYTIIILLVVLSLMHELIFFFAPYFFFSMYYYSSKEKAVRIRLLIFISILSVVLIALYRFGKKIEDGHTLEMLRERGIIFSRGGILRFKKRPIDIIEKHIGGFYLYLVSLFYQIILFAKFLRIVSGEPMRKYISMVVFCFIFSLPIFFLAVDWGRWLYIHFVLFSITLISLLEVNLKWESSAIKRKDITIKNLFWITLSLSVCMKHTAIGISVSKFLTSIF